MGWKINNSYFLYKAQSHFPQGNFYQAGLVFLRQRSIDFDRLQRRLQVLFLQNTSQQINISILRSLGLNLKIAILQARYENIQLSVRRIFRLIDQEHNNIFLQNGFLIISIKILLVTFIRLLNLLQFEHDNSKSKKTTLLISEVVSTKNSTSKSKAYLSQVCSHLIFIIFAYQI